MVLAADYFPQTLDKTNKYERQAKDPTRMVRHVVLKCITDGAELVFVDEGPFERDATGKPQRWQQMLPSGGRQNVLRQLKKRTKDGLPVFWSTEPVAPVWDHALQTPIPIPVCGESAPKEQPWAPEKFHAYMAESLKVREQVKEEQRRARTAKADQEKRESEERTTRLEDRISNAIAGAFAAVGGKKNPRPEG